MCHFRPSSYQHHHITARNMSDSSNMPRVEQTCIYILLLMAFVSSACNRRRIIHTLSYDGCQPKRLYSFACDGACASYSRPSVDVSGELDRYCECCKETETRMLRTFLRCPNSDGRSIRRILVRVNIPTGCSCRPCSALPPAIIPAEDELQNGKRSPPYDVISEINGTIWNDDDRVGRMIEQGQLNKIVKGQS